MKNLLLLSVYWLLFSSFSYAQNAGKEIGIELELSEGWTAEYAGSSPVCQCESVLIRNHSTTKEDAINIVIYPIPFEDPDRELHEHVLNMWFNDQDASSKPYTSPHFTYEQTTAVLQPSSLENVAWRFRTTGKFKKKELRYFVYAWGTPAAMDTNAADIFAVVESIKRAGKK